MLRELAELTLLDEARPAVVPRARLRERGAGDRRAGDRSRPAHRRRARSRSRASARAPPTRSASCSRRAGWRSSRTLRGKHPRERGRAAAHPGPRAEGGAGGCAPSSACSRSTTCAARSPSTGCAGSRGFGAKSEEKLAQALARLDAEGPVDRTPISVALPLATRIVERLREVPGVTHASYCGSLRRFSETIGDVDIVVAASEPGAGHGGARLDERGRARARARRREDERRHPPRDAGRPARRGAAPARRGAPLLHRLEGPQHQAPPARARPRPHAERVRALRDRRRPRRRERDRGADLRGARPALHPAGAARGRRRDRGRRGRAAPAADRRGGRRLPRAHLALGRRALDARGGGRRRRRARLPRARDHRSRRGHAARASAARPCSSSARRCARCRPSSATR